MQNQQANVPPAAPPSAEMARLREQTRAEIERGFYDVRLIEIEVEETPSVPIGMMAAWIKGKAPTSARCSAAFFRNEGARSA